MSKLLVIAQHDGKQLSSATARAVSCAQAIGGGITVAVFAKSADTLGKEAAKLDGVGQVLTIERDENANPLAAVLAPQIAALSTDFSHVLMASTTFGKDVLPRAAALAGSPMVTDVMEVLSEREFKRPIYAGNVIATVSVPGDAVLFATARAASWKPVGGDGDAKIEARELSVELPTHTEFVKLDAEESERPDLQSAPRVVSGGRGVGSKENFDIIYKFADKLGAAVGASRAAVDAGFVPNDFQVGQTGKIIAPELYVAVGISGAIQHLTGIKDAGTIVAINKDADAPIFEVADLGLVGDLFEVLPELEAELDK
ncbi:MAG: electron transfer flavoprotein subunit alpha/FixB family protein [Gammaproteobacteria bacterium]